VDPSDTGTLATSKYNAAEAISNPTVKARIRLIFTYSPYTRQVGGSRQRRSRTLNGSVAGGSRVAPARSFQARSGVHKDRSATYTSQRARWWGTQQPAYWCAGCTNSSERSIPASIRSKPENA